MRKALYKYRHHDYFGAVKLYERAIAQDPTNAAPQSRLGEYYQLFASIKSALSRSDKMNKVLETLKASGCEKILPSTDELTYFGLQSSIATCCFTLPKLEARTFRRAERKEVTWETRQNIIELFSCVGQVSRPVMRAYVEAVYPNEATNVVD